MPSIFPWPPATRSGRLREIVPPRRRRGSRGFDEPSPSFRHEDPLDKIEDKAPLAENENFVAHGDGSRDDLEKNNHLGKKKRQERYARRGSLQWCTFTTVMRKRMQKME